ncbi:MAG: cyclic pyranopterin monophosphate synthase MoaC, partial [Thermoplasmataceae archaeon]
METVYNEFDITTNMINVSEKPITRRTAVASGKIMLKPSTVENIRQKKVKKGDVGEALKIAAVQG